VLRCSTWWSVITASSTHSDLGSMWKNSVLGRSHDLTFRDSFRLSPLRSVRLLSESELQSLSFFVPSSVEVICEKRSAAQ
jgi:hypothetical protein